MKRILFNAALLVAGLLTLTTMQAQDKEKNEPKFKKSKSFSKSYSLSGSDKVTLNNQFGEMKLVTWDKNEIKVDVSITGKSDDEQRAQEIIDRISIADGKESGGVFFKTKFADEKKHSDKGDKKEHRNEGMEINYMVYLPAGNPLNAENQFGKMIVPDYKGEAVITCKFGSLTAGKISNAKEVSVEFGRGTIEQVNGGRLSIKFSEGTVNKLGGDVRSKLEFSQVKLSVDNDAKNLDIDNSYSSVYLSVDKNFGATWDVHTSHGSFSNKTAFAIKKEGDDNRDHGPRFDERYSGISGSGGCKVKIRSSFGEVVAGHDLKVDFSEKKRSKSNRTI